MVERASTRILKREQERIDEIMEIVFSYPSKKKFKQFDKGKEDGDEAAPDSEEEEEDVKIETSSDGQIILK